MSNVTNKSEYLVEVNNLKQYFPVKTGFMKIRLSKQLTVYPLTLSQVKHWVW